MSRTSASTVAACTAAGLLGAVTLFQVALVLGAPWGAWTQGGGIEGVLPASGRAIAAVSAVVVVVFALGLLARAGIGPLRSAPRRVVSVVAWVATVYSGLGVVMNLASPSVAERLTWVPVTAVVFACSVVVLRTTRRSRTGDVGDREAAVA